MIGEEPPRSKVERHLLRRRKWPFCPAGRISTRDGWVGADADCARAWKAARAFCRPCLALIYIGFLADAPPSGARFPRGAVAGINCLAEAAARESCNFRPGRGGRRRAGTPLLARGGFASFFGLLGGDYGVIRLLISEAVWFNYAECAGGLTGAGVVVYLKELLAALSVSCAY